MFAADHLKLAMYFSKNCVIKSCLPGVRAWFHHYVRDRDPSGWYNFPRVTTSLLRDSLSSRNLLCSRAWLSLSHPWSQRKSGRAAGLSNPEATRELEQIDNLGTKLYHISEGQKVTLDLYYYLEKLLSDLDAQEQVVFVNNILQNAQEPLRPITTVLPRKQPKKGNAGFRSLLS